MFCRALFFSSFTTEEFIRLDFPRKGSMHGVMTERETPMTENDQIVRLMRKLRYRLGQAHRIAQAAETCAIEGCHDHSMRLLEEVEELTRDAAWCRLR